MDYKDIFDAVQSGTVEDVQFFIEKKGVKVNVKNDNDQTPLHKAVNRGSIEITKYLLSKGADVHAKDHGGLTPLTEVVFMSGNIALAKMLVSEGADVHAKDNDGTTPLHVAAMSGFVETAKYLVSVGSEVNANDNKYSFTPLDFARNYGHTAVVQFLTSIGGK
jgi:ankyrin repeat protein